MKFIQDKIFENVTGEEVEHILIKNNEGHILIFEYENKIKILNIANEKDIIRKIIELSIENDYLSDLVEEQGNELEQLENKIEQYKEK